MNDTAEHLVDKVLPQVPIRQWVCSFSWQLRYIMGYDKKLTSEILAAFMNTIIQSVKRRAKRMLNLANLDSCETGAALVIQRFDSALCLNVHGHSVVLDGVYVKRNGLPVFYPLADPTEHDVNWVAHTSWRRIEKILKKHGWLPDDEQASDQLSDEQPVLAHCYSQSTHGSGALRLLTEVGNTRPSSTSISPSTGKNIVVKPEVSDPAQMPLFNSEKDPNTAAKQSWSKLLARVFKIDVTICTKV